MAQFLAWEDLILMILSFSLIFCKRGNVTRIALNCFISVTANSF